VKLGDLPLAVGGGTMRASRASVAGFGELQNQIEDTDEQQEVEEDTHRITSGRQVEK